MLGQYMHQKKDQNSLGFSSGTGGAIAGADWKVHEYFHVGFSGAYLYSYLGALHKGGHSNINQGTLATYTVINITNWTMNASILGGYSHINSFRNYSSNHLHGKSHGWQLSPHFDVGYTGICKNTWYNVVPFAMADYVADWQSSYKEHGSATFATSQNGKYFGFVRVESGLNFFQNIAVKYGTLILKEKGSWGYQRGTGSTSSSVSVVAATTAFAVPLSAYIQNLGIVGFSMTFLAKNKHVPDMEFSYEGQFGSKFISQLGSIHLSKRF